MIDPKLLRGDLTDLQQQLATRGYALDMAFWQSIENERKSLQVKTEELQSRRNAAAKQVGALKNAGADASDLLDRRKRATGEISPA